MKKEYDCTNSTVHDNGIKPGRFYRDFQDYIEFDSASSIVNEKDYPLPSSASITIPSKNVPWKKIVNT